MSHSFTKTSSQTISYPHQNIYDGFGSYLTISVWLKLPSWNQGSGVISKRSNADDTISYALNLDNFFGPSVYLIVGDGSGGIYCTYRVNATNFPTGKWVNIVAIYDGTQPASNRIKIYLDGVLQTTIVGTDSSVLMTNVNFQLYLGRDHEAGTFYLNGSMAEVGIWARALGLTDVRAIARGFHPDMINRSALRFYSSLLGNRTYDAKNFFLPSSISSVPSTDHPKVINRLSPSSNVFFAGGEFAGPTDTPSYVGRYCHGVRMYINRSEESILQIKT